MKELNELKLAFTAVLLYFGTAIALPAQTVTPLFDFDSSKQGSYPWGPLVQGTNGNLYGIAFLGGANDMGAIFEITPDGTETTLHSFDGADGDFPNNGLVLGSDGNFYGTAYGGGANAANGDGGTVFRVTPEGDLTVLYSFCAQTNCTDGSNPQAGLVQGSDGNFYGTTHSGGTHGCGIFDCGTLFKITPAGVLTTLYDFCSQGLCVDGQNPAATLVLGREGNFYGTTNAGGEEGAGTVFKITPGGKLSTLVSLQLGSTGSSASPLIEGSNGDFYGTTSLFGPYEWGTAFELNPNQGPQGLTILHGFCSEQDCLDGINPSGALLQPPDGNLYGTAFSGGGPRSAGTLFKITPAGAFTKLYTFCSQENCFDGSGPAGSLVQATNGEIYGTATGGGLFHCKGGCGTVFGLSLGFAPFVETNAASAEVGANILILGNGLTGATSVTFNGVAASFTVESATYIKATVPSGATTGPVQVVTPSGTLTSNVNFQVLP